MRGPDLAAELQETELIPLLGLAGSRNSGSRQLTWQVAVFP